MEEKRFRRTQEETRTPGKSFAGNLALGSNLGRERIGQVAGLLQRRYGQWNGFAHASALGRQFIEKFLGRKTASTKEQGEQRIGVESRGGGRCGTQVDLFRLDQDLRRAGRFAT